MSQAPLIDRHARRRHIRQRFILVGLLMLVLIGCSPEPTHEPLPNNAVVLVLGDSLASGVGAPDGEDFPTKLGELTGWTVVNGGVSGNTASQGLGRLPDLLEQAPRMVIIELGGNDFLRRAPPGTVKSTLRTIIATVRSAGALPVLVGIPMPSLVGAATGSLKDASLYAELAEEEDVLLVSGLVANLLSQESLKADPIHLNAKGYTLLAEGLVDYFQAQGLLPAQ